VKAALAPVCVFAHRRVEHLSSTIEALRKNNLASDSELIIFSDAAKIISQEQEIERVREYIRGISGFAKLTVVEQEAGQGLSRSITAGVSKVVAEHGRVIVLEDDLVTAPYFLQFMNEGLNRYSEDFRVASIHGYVYPVHGQLPETFFVRGADCWGWATWSRAWDLVDWDAARLLSQLRSLKLVEEFDLGGVAPYSVYLEDLIRGENDSWAVRWHASVYLKGMLTLYPGQSLVRNIGNDGSGTHGANEKCYDVRLAERPIAVNAIPVCESDIARALFAKFWRRSKVLRAQPPSYAARWVELSKELAFLVFVRLVRTTLRPLHSIVACIMGRARHAP